jgi:branched-chain amino acid transport system permease protein
MTQVVLFNVFNGLIVGAFYALMALGLSLILNLSGVNFAHGGFLALGAYLAFTLIPYIGFWGALIVAPLLTAALGLVIERLLIRPLYGGDPLYGLLLTFGLAYIFEDATRFISGAQSMPFQLPAWLTTSLSSQFFFVTGYRVFMIIVVVAAVRGLFAVLNYTRLGMRIRAGTRDLDTVSTLGVNVRVLRSLNFGIGIYMAGLAGVLAAGLLAKSLAVRLRPEHRRGRKGRLRRPTPYCDSYGLSADAPCATDVINSDCEQQNDAARRILIERRHVHQAHTVVEAAHQQRSEQGADDSTTTARKRCAANDCGGDRVEFQEQACRAADRPAYPSGQCDPSDAVAEACDNKIPENYPLDIDA